MLHHITARLFAFAAFLGAHFHVLIVRELFALLAALGACLGASLANIRSEWSATGHDLGRCDAKVCAILASGQRRHVLFLSCMQQVSTVRSAHVARALTIRTCLGARLEHVVMLSVMDVIAPVLRYRGLGQRYGGACCKSGHCKFSSTDHINIP